MADDDGSSSYNYYICPQVPSLHCHNNSTMCIEGNASIDARRHSHLNLPTQEGGYHCVCQEGYIGHECRMQVDNCNDDDPTTLSCYHGSKCRSTHNNNNNNSNSKGGGDDHGGYYCDCLQLNNNEIIRNGPTKTAKKYAGLMCQHEATSLCAAALVGITTITTTSSSSSGYFQPTTGDQFCTNHGKCVKLVTSYDDSHPGCVCQFGWGGDHCEVWQQGEGNAPSSGAATLQKSSIKETSAGNAVIAWYILLGLFVVALSSVVVGIIVLLIKDRNSRRGKNAASPDDDSVPKVVESGQSPPTSICMSSPIEEERDVTQEDEKEFHEHDDKKDRNELSDRELV